MVRRTACLHVGRSATATSEVNTDHCGAELEAESVDVVKLRVQECLGSVLVGAEPETLEVGFSSQCRFLMTEAPPPDR